ncbi:hypothetical protein [Epilithonimonas sp.]|uniref:hypothetical protein n=1 Tax=Epilithonimonas sp. TaxID=2894511 RepID=UPI0035B4DE2C
MKEIIIKKENTKLSIAHILKVVYSMGCNISFNDFKSYMDQYNDKGKIKIEGNLESINKSIDHFKDLDVNFEIKG